MLDSYHVCEYLGEAAKAIEPQPQVQQTWLNVQKQRLKDQQPEAVLQALHAHLEPALTDDERAPVRRCHRYLVQRLHQLNYRDAIDQGLPIGSGEIASAHRYLVQKRLKLPGAWWLAANADRMLALRVNRANGEWQDCWATDYCYAA